MSILIGISLIALVAVSLTACGSNAPSAPTVAPGNPIPVTYYPTPVKYRPIAIAAAAAPRAAVQSTTPRPLATLTPPPATEALPPTQPLVQPTETASPAPATNTPAPRASATTATVATATSAPVADDSGCPTTSSASFDLIPIDGPPYKNNALTDENADLRLSVLGYSPVNEARNLIDLPGSADPGAPKLHGLFEPNRTPAIAQTYKRYDWNWSEGAGAAPYGARDGINTDPQAPVAVVDLAVTAGEAVYPPERSAEIFTGANAMVLYAGEKEITLNYTRRDDVADGYMVHLLNLCVDPNLLAAYRAQAPDGKHSTGMLPAVRNNQPIGAAAGNVLTVAIRDRARFLDPRSRKDWW